MTFKLTIELGNEAMQTPFQIHSALLRVANKLLRSGDPTVEAEPDHGRIIDVNGNVVGQWEIA